MNLRALIFDVDGTLSETEEAHRTAFNRAFVEAGMDWFWTVEDYARLLQTTGGKERMHRYRTDIRAKHPNDAEISVLHKRKTKLYAQIVATGGLSLRPGVADLIATAKAAGLRIAVATTTNRPNVETLCRACWGKPASEVFDVIAAGDEVRSKKPAPDVFNLALDRLGLAPSSCIAFEDSRNGLLSAKRAGLPVVVMPSAYTATEVFTEADWVVPRLTLAHLPNILHLKACA